MQQIEQLALLVIGDEVLRGDVEDANTPYLARFCFQHGVRLARVVVVSDDKEEIAEELNRLRARYDMVLTSGGVGPTHDDVTIEAVSHAFGVAAVEDAHLRQNIIAHYGARANRERLRMARKPEGAEVISGSFRWVPILRKENVFVLPGVPWLFRLCVDFLAARFPAAALTSEYVYLKAAEGDIAARLREIQNAHTQVVIGSYPNFDRHPSIKISIVGKQAHEVAQVSTLIRETFAEYLLP